MITAAFTDGKALICAIPSRAKNGLYLVKVEPQNDQLIVTHRCPAHRFKNNCSHVIEAVASYREWQWWEAPWKVHNRIESKSRSLEACRKPPYRSSRVMRMLPEILPIAKKHGLKFNPKTFGKKETLCKCPFCKEDAKPGKERKFYLSLNTEDQVYKCWFCGESGGVFRFVSLLEGIPESKVIDRYYKQKGSRYKRHPAERLSLSQYRLMGYEQKPDFVGLSKANKELYKLKRNECWQDWQAFVDAEKRLAFQRLVVGIEKGQYQKVVQSIRERENEIGTELLKPVLHIYSLSERPEWAEQAEAFALHVCRAIKYPSPSTDQRMKGAS